MPPGDFENDRLIVKAVREGKLDESVVDQACERVLDVNFPLHREPRHRSCI